MRELDDLEGQAAGLHLVERDATVAELSVAQYSEVALADRLHASVGRRVAVVLRGGGAVEGEVTQVGRDWLLVGRDRSETVVRLAAVLRVRGASERAVPEEVRGALARLALGSALRQLASEGEELALTLVDGTVLRGRVRRVGKDFVELAPETGEAGQVELVAVDGLAALRRG